jgi:hypothetical protein
MPVRFTKAPALRELDVGLTAETGIASAQPTSSARVPVVSSSPRKREAAGTARPSTRDRPATRERSSGPPPHTARETAIGTGKRGGNMYQRTELEEYLLRDEADDGPSSAEGGARKKGTSPVSRGTVPQEATGRQHSGHRSVVDAGGDDSGAEARLGFRVLREAPVSTKAAAFVTLRQRQESHATQMAMKSAALAFPGKLQPGLPHRVAAAGEDEGAVYDSEVARQQRRSAILNARLRQQQQRGGNSNSDERLTCELPPAAAELFMREYQQQQGLLEKKKVRNDETEANHHNSGNNGAVGGSHKVVSAAEKFLADQLAAVQRDGRVASRHMEQRLLSALQSPDEAHRGGTPSPPSRSPTRAELRANKTAAEIFADVVRAVRGNPTVDAVTTAAVGGQLHHGNAAEPLTREGSPSRVTTSRSASYLPKIRTEADATPRPATEQQHQRKYDARVSLSRNGRRVASRAEPGAQLQQQHVGLVSAPQFAVMLPLVQPSHPVQPDVGDPVPPHLTPVLVVQDDTYVDEEGEPSTAHALPATPEEQQPTTRSANAAAATPGTAVRFRLSSAAARQTSPPSRQSDAKRAAAASAALGSPHLPAPPSVGRRTSTATSAGGQSSARLSAATAMSSPSSCLPTQFSPSYSASSAPSHSRVGGRVAPSAEIPTELPELTDFGPWTPAAELKLRRDFADWAPSALHEASTFASLGRWADLTFDRARQFVESAALAEAKGRGSLVHDIEALLQQKARDRQDAFDAQQKRKERRQQASTSASAVLSAAQDDDDSDDGLDDEFPTAPISSGPNRVLLNAALMIVDQALSTNAAHRAAWPLLRDEIFAAVFVNYRRRATRVVPMTGDHILEHVDAVENVASIPVKYWDPKPHDSVTSDDAERGGADPRDQLGAAAAVAANPPASSVLECIHQGRTAFEEYRALRTEHKRVAGVIAAQSKASDRLAMITQMAFNRNSRRAIIGSFQAWRALTRQSKYRRLAVCALTDHQRASRLIDDAFREWRRVAIQSNLRRVEKKCEELKTRIMTTTKEHAETVTTMNSRYDADVKALEFELFQEAERRMNILQVQQLEQQEWERETAVREEEAKTLKRVVRQWQRAAQLSNPVDDPTAPPKFLLSDAKVLKLAEDQLMSFYVNTAVMSGGSGAGGGLSTSAALTLSALPPSPAVQRANSFASNVSGSQGVNADNGARVIDAATLDYLNGGWADNIPAPPAAQPSAMQAFAELLVSARKDLEVFLSTWVNYEIRNVKAPSHAAGAATGGGSGPTTTAAGALQITNCTTDLRDGTVFLALCRALTPKEHQRKGDLDVFLTLASLMGLQSAHGLLPPLLLHCPTYRDFFVAEAFRPPAPGTGPAGPAAVSLSQHPTAGMWILASLFVARCLKVSTSSKFAIHRSLAPQVMFSPGIQGMPRPPASILMSTGPDLVAMTNAAATADALAIANGAKLLTSEAASGRRSASGQRTGSQDLGGTLRPNGKQGLPLHPAQRGAQPAKAAGGGGKGPQPKRQSLGGLTARSLNEHTASLGGGRGRGRGAQRPGSAVSDRSNSSASSFDSEYDEDDEWLAQEDDDNFRIAVPDDLRKLGPSQLIAHWIKLRSNGEQWNGLARVVTALVLRHRVLDPPPSSPKGAAGKRSVK